MRFILASLVVCSMFPGNTARAQDTARRVDTTAATQSGDEYKLLKSLVGEWSYHASAVVAPGEDPMTCEGAETTRAFGDNWFICNLEGQMGDVKVSGIMTLGYDPVQKKYIGTWIDSVNKHMFIYDGSLDETGKVLSLLTSGPDFADPTKTRQMKDVIELIDNDHRTLTSYMLDDSGAWVQFMKSEYTRKK